MRNKLSTSIFSIMIFMTFFLTRVSHADEQIVDTKAGGTVLSKIKMNVKTPSCSVTFDNDTVSFGKISSLELHNGTARRLPAKINVDCVSSPANIALKIEPSDLNGEVDTQPGVIKSNTSGSGFRLSWADNLVGSTDEAIQFGYSFNLPAIRKSKVNLTIQPVAISNDIESGHSSASVIITIEYS